MNLTPADFDRDAVREARLFWITGTGLSEDPSRSTLLELVADRGAAIGPGGARAGGAQAGSAEPPRTILDLDYRPTFWSSAEEARRWIGEALRHVTVALGNQDEVEVAVRERDPRRAVELLLERGVTLAIVKQGGDGVLAATRDQVLEMAPIRLPVVNGLGAGDAFGGALAHGLVNHWPLERTLTLANAAGALAASRLACSDDFGTAEELEELLASRGARAGASVPLGDRQQPAVDQASHRRSDPDR